MEILITNDDGWGVQGLMVLARHMTRLGHVTIVAPESVTASTFRHLQQASCPKKGPRSPCTRISWCEKIP